MRAGWTLARVAFFAAALGACRHEPEPPASRPDTAVDSAASEVAVWRPLGEWSGRGDRQTESFDVISGALQLVWEATNASAPTGGRLRVILHSSISGRPLQTVVDARGTGIDTVYAADEPRVSYLVIESEGVDWRVTLEERVPAPR
jgi:hypothetical protein